MNIFEEQNRLHKTSEKIFEKSMLQINRGILLSDEAKANFEKKGREILPVEIVNNFLLVRCQYWHNVVNKKLCEYTYWEWIVCIQEKVLLEYALPILSNALLECPMLCGMLGEWEVLYEISKIHEEFWSKHKDWKYFFAQLIKSQIDQKEAVIKDEYINQMKLFLEYLQEDIVV